MKNIEINVQEKKHNATIFRTSMLKKCAKLKSSILV